MRKANYMQTGVIFNIQKFSINDGPGIRTVVFSRVVLCIVNGVLIPKVN